MSSSTSQMDTLFIIGLIILWYSDNIGVLILNKFRLSNYGFAFPIFLTMCPMSACAVLTYISIMFLKIVPVQRIKYSSQILSFGPFSQSLYTSLPTRLDGWCTDNTTVFPFATSSPSVVTACTPPWRSVLKWVRLKSTHSGRPTSHVRCSLSSSPRRKIRVSRTGREKGRVCHGEIERGMVLQPREGGDGNCENGGG